MSSSKRAHIHKQDVPQTFWVKTWKQKQQDRGLGSSAEQVRDSLSGTKILACRWILLGLQLNKRYQENNPSEKEQHSLKAARNKLRSMTKNQTTNPDASKWPMAQEKSS